MDTTGTFHHGNTVAFTSRKQSAAAAATYVKTSLKVSELDTKYSSNYSTTMTTQNNSSRKAATKVVFHPSDHRLLLLLHESTTVGKWSFIVMGGKYTNQDLHLLQARIDSQTFFFHLAQASPSCRNVFSSVSSDMITSPEIALVFIAAGGQTANRVANIS